MELLFQSDYYSHLTSWREGLNGNYQTEECDCYNISFESNRINFIAAYNSNGKKEDSDYSYYLTKYGFIRKN